MGERICIRAQTNHRTVFFPANDGAHAVAGESMNLFDRKRLEKSFNLVSGTGRVHPDFRVLVHVAAEFYDAAGRFGAYEFCECVNCLSHLFSDPLAN